VTPVAESAEGRQAGVARFVLNVDDSSADVVVTMVGAWYEDGVGPLLASSLVYRARRGRQRRSGQTRPGQNPGTGSDSLE
jgi:hypothetical protein